MTSRDSRQVARPLERLGPYSLVIRIAVGGTAEVYLGFREGKETFRKFYAIKVLHRGRRSLPQFEGLLADEAALVSQLDHPNIVSVHDYGQVDGVSFIVMDYVHGRDLRRLLDLASGHNVRFPDVISAWIASEICEALFYAHSRTHPDGSTLALVHRDISPPNILIGFEGVVKVADFGVAHSSVIGRSETKTGVIKGKLQYMPPEYAVGNLQDGRGDIFSLGLVLFELLTNRQAYSDRDGIDVMVESIRVGDVPDLRRLRPDLEPELIQIVARSLAPRPAHRYQTADEMGSDLRHYVSRKVPGFTRSRLQDVIRQLFEVTGGHFPESNALLGDTLEATGLDHLVEVARNPSEEKVVEVGPPSEKIGDETMEGRLYVNSGEGSYPDDVDDWAVAPTSTRTPRPDAPGADYDDPNVPPPRILSPSGYVRDVDEEKANMPTEETPWDPIEIPADSIEPIDPEEAPTGRIEQRSLRDLADPSKD